MVIMEYNNINKKVTEGKDKDGHEWRSFCWI